MTELTQLIDTHLGAWTEPDAGRRADLVAQVWSEDGRLIDPPFVGEGHAGITEMGALVQQHYPGHRFRRTSEVDAHHDYLRFAWELVGPDGAVALSGVDVGELGGDGRLRRITGFFGELPARAAA